LCKDSENKWKRSNENKEIIAYAPPKSSVFVTCMKAQGFPLESISKALGLSIEDIEKL
jgi:hypothetical protein